MSTYFDAFRRAIFLSIVPLVLITDQLPVSASAEIFLPLWAVQYLLMSLSNNLLGRGHNRLLMTEFFDLSKMFAFIQASMTLVTGKRVHFQVTPKGVGVGKRRLQRITPFGIVAIIYVAAIGIGLLRITGTWLHTGNLSVQFAALAWAVAIILVLGSVSVYGYRKISARAADRVAVKMKGSYQVEGSPLVYTLATIDITTSGCAFQCEVPPSLGSHLRLTLRSQVGTRGLSLQGTVRRVTDSGENFVIGLEVSASMTTQVAIAELLASSVSEQGRSPTLEDRAKAA